MSNRVLNYVFDESPATGNDRLVLFAIADEADDDGTNAYPSIDRIARKSRVNKRTVMRCLQRLEETGELVVHRPETRGRGHHNTYRVVMRKGDTVSPSETARNGDTSDAETARNGAPKGALDPLTHGSNEPDPSTPASTARATRIAEPFMLTPAMHEWAAENAPTVDVRAETAKFVDHFRGSGGRKVDWLATWRNWMRRAGESRPSTAPRPTRSDRTAQSIENVRALFS